MDIVAYRRRLGWSQNELARRARLDPDTVRKAEKGVPVSAQSAAAIADAISMGVGERVLPGDIKGLKVSV